MELEPITRQEQIIAGKDLEPITRMEKFLKKYGGSGGSGGVSPEEVTTIVKEQFPGGVGHKTVEQAFAPIVWDGNTEGLESITVNGTNGVVTFCRVAEYAQVTSLSQIDKLGSVTLQNGQIAQEDEINLPEALAEYEMEDMFMVSENGWQYQAYFVASNGKESVTAGDVFAETVTFPEGIWFGYTSIPEYSVAQYPTKLTATTTTNLATINKKFLPEHLQFGKDKAFEPIVWDGNTEGLERVELAPGVPGLIKISDKVVPITDGENPVDSITVDANGTVSKYCPVNLVESMPGCWYADENAALFITEANEQVAAYGFSAGVWTPEVVASIEITPKTTIKPISAEYLPNVADIPETWIADLKAALGI